MVWWLVLGVGILLFVGILIGNYFFHMALARNEKSFIRDETRVGKDYDWFHEASGYHDEYMMSKDGLRLHAYRIAPKQDKHAYAVLVHGYMGNALQMISAARRFSEQGYGILLCDLRAHGKSEGKVIGFGGSDSDDVLAWCKYLITNEHAESIFLYGVSMGAATVMMCSDRVPEQVRCIIEDCGYATLKQQFAYLLDTKFHYPKVLVLPCANIVMKYRAHYQMQDVEPCTHVAKAKVPMLFIHGNKDDFVPFYMLDEVYEACPQPKQKVVIEGAGHAKSHHVNPTLYWNRIDAWLQTYMK